MSRHRQLHPAAALAALLLLGLLRPALAQDDAASLYQRNCAGCHGPARQGTGLGPALSPATYRYGGSRDDLARIITRGIPSQGMPAFGGTLSPADIAALAAFLPARRVAGAGEPEPDTTPRPFDPVPGPVQALDYTVQVEVFADGLQTVWALAFLDARTALATERGGRLRLIRDGVLDPRPIQGTPTVHVSSHEWNQGGLLDIALPPDFADSGWIYLSYSHRLGSDTEGRDLVMTRVVRGRLRSHAWVDEEVVFQAPAAAYSDTAWHYGGRMAFAPDGQLLLPVGDRGTMERARDPADPAGKIHRLAVPAAAGARPAASLHSRGHRNPQGMAVDPGSGRVWATEHGPRGGDELNLIRAGADYGWPIASHGINYDGTVLTPHTRLDGTEQPVHFWRPSIGVSGLAFYQGEAFPLWNGKLLVTALGRRELRLLTLDGERVQHEETLLRTRGRPYEPVVGPDGAIYVVTDDPGQILRLRPLREQRQ